MGSPLRHIASWRPAVTSIVASALSVRLVHTPPTTLEDLIARVVGARVCGGPFAGDSRAVAGGEFLSSKEEWYIAWQANGTPAATLESS